MNFKTTFRLEKPTQAWLIESNHEPQRCVVNDLTAGYDEFCTDIGGGSNYLVRRWGNRIIGHLSVDIDVTNAPHDFWLIIDGGHVVQHCQFGGKITEQGGEFIAVYLSHIPAAVPERSNYLSEALDALGICCAAMDRTDSVNTDRGTMSMSNYFASEREIAVKVLNPFHDEEVDVEKQIEEEQRGVRKLQDRYKCAVCNEWVPRKFITVRVSPAGYMCTDCIDKAVAKREGSGRQGPSQLGVSMAPMIKEPECQLCKPSAEASRTTNLDYQLEHELDHNTLVEIREDMERWLRVLPEKEV
jgi:hypothetical protein